MLLVLLVWSAVTGAVVYANGVHPLAAAGVSYERARQLVAGTHPWNPLEANIGHTTLLAAALATGTGATGVVAVQLLAGMLALLCVGDLGRHLGGWAAGISAALLVALNTDLAQWHTHCLPDSLYLSGLVVVVWLVGVAGAAGRRAWWTHAGALVLVWFLGLWLALPAILAFWCRARAHHLAAVAVFLLAGLSLWLLHQPWWSNPVMLFVDGDVIQGYETWWVALEPDTAGTDVAGASDHWLGPWRYAAQHPLGCLHLALVRVCVEFGQVRPYYAPAHNLLLLLVVPLVAVLALVGWLHYRRHQPLATLLAGVVLMHTAAVALCCASWEGRWSAAVWPALSVLASAGGAAVLPARQRTVQVAVVAGSALLAALLTVNTDPTPSWELEPPPAITTDPPRTAWKVASTLTLKGCTLQLSEPVLVARTRGHLHFPTLVRVDEQALLVLASNQPDSLTAPDTVMASWSLDRGLNWQPPQPAALSDSPVRLPDGELLLLPVYLDQGTGGLVGRGQLVGKAGSPLTATPRQVTVTGWPRPPGWTAPQLHRASFVFSGPSLASRPTGYLATLYGAFAAEQRSSLVVAHAADGYTWVIRSVIADGTSNLPGTEGPTEAVLGRLHDGRLLCIFRLGSGLGYCRSVSEDEGRHWTEPVQMQDVASVQPGLVVLPDGVTLLSGGRPGLHLWINLDGSATAWQGVDMQAHHNACRPADGFGAAWQTSGYTEIVALDAQTLLFVYDRNPRHGHPLPPQSSQTNSVWVVRITLDRGPLTP
jgi:hypothetical protein